REKTAGAARPAAERAFRICRRDGAERIARRVAPARRSVGGGPPQRRRLEARAEAAADAPQRLPLDLPHALAAHAPPAREPLQRLRGPLEAEPMPHDELLVGRKARHQSTDLLLEVVLEHADLGGGGLLAIGVEPFLEPAPLLAAHHVVEGDVPLADE